MTQQENRLTALTELNGRSSLSQPHADWWPGPLGLIMFREYLGSSWDGCLGDGGYKHGIHEEVGSCWICVLGRKSEDLDSVGPSRRSLLTLSQPHKNEGRRSTKKSKRHHLCSRIEVPELGTETREDVDHVGWSAEDSIHRLISCEVSYTSIPCDGVRPWLPVGPAAASIWHVLPRPMC